MLKFFLLIDIFGSYKILIKIEHLISDLLVEQKGTCKGGLRVRPREPEVSESLIASFLFGFFNWHLISQHEITYPRHPRRRKGFQNEIGRRSIQGGGFLFRKPHEILCPRFYHRSSKREADRFSSSACSPNRFNLNSYRANPHPSFLAACPPYTPDTLHRTCIC